MRENRPTFEEREGLIKPAQMQRGHVSKETRALLWAIFHECIKKETDIDRRRVSGRFNQAVFTYWIRRCHRAADEYSSKASHVIEFVKNIVMEQSYGKTLGFCEFVLSVRVDSDLNTYIKNALSETKCAYRVFDGDLIAPIGVEEEADTLERALNAAKENGFSGVRKHFRNSAQLLTEGKFADSIRESIHAVAATARRLDPKSNNTLGPALNMLQRKGVLPNNQLKSAITSLYAYTNTSEGIRHELFSSSQAAEDEADALFMLGACASFVSFLIAKAQNSGIELQPESAESNQSTGLE
ncbi:hypothetical protein FHS85_002939 [Rhodoligotrophos appendicifer]|uniref:AbiJ-NTD4 domain-containing protein n=1 Tax=Rhodoligotrophos appendicifer TaxID=987056 RepID=UPI0019611831|nr:hypothetical protein [Rhodoligotrophos appendicifer]